MTPEIHLMIKDYRLTTAEIFYHLPDYPGVLQTYLWQDYDIAPEFPQLCRFVDFWHHHLDGRLHSIYVASRKLILPTDWRSALYSTTIQ